MNTKNLKNKITKIIIISLLLLLINANTVIAKTKSYTTREVETGTTELIEEREYTDKDAFIVCSYSCSSDNIGTEGGKCGNEGSNFSAIYYYPEQLNKWKIKTDLYLSPVKITTNGRGDYYAHKDTSAEPVISKYIWESIGNIIPSGGIYYEAPTGTNKNESWLDSETYNSLKKSFECPQKIYYDHTIELSYDHVSNINENNPLDMNKRAWAKLLQDSDNNSMEICYANELEKCKERNEKEKTTFGKANNLSYSLTQELSTILNSVSTDLSSLEASKILERGFETQNDICTALQNGAYNELTNSDTYEGILNDLFNNRVSASSPNKELYNVKKLSTLLIPGKSANKDLNLIYNSESLSEKYNSIKDIYKTKLVDSVKYYAPQCHVDINVIDTEKISSMIDDKITKIVSDYGKIDYSELNCDTLFADMADIIKDAYFALEIISVIIIIIRTALDYSKVFLSDDKDSLKKSNNNLMKRIVILIVILLLPALVNLFLRLFKIQGFNSENPLCIEIKQK